MSAATTLPTWAVYVVSLGTPATAFVGVLIGNFLTRRGSKELEKRSNREETMRNLRWAAELAVSEDEGKAQLGVAELRALGASEMLSKEQQGFIDAALGAVLEEPLEEIREAGDDAEVILAPGRVDFGNANDV